MGLDVPGADLRRAWRTGRIAGGAAIAQRGQRVAADAITYPGWKLAPARPDLEPIAFDGDGPCRTSWSGYRAAGGSAVLHARGASAHGLGHAAQRCRAIAELARKHDFALIEDLTYRHLAPRASSGLPAGARTDLAGRQHVWPAGRRAALWLPGRVRPEPARAGRPGHVGLACAPLLIELARHWLEDGTSARSRRGRRHMRAHCGPSPARS